MNEKNCDDYMRRKTMLVSGLGGYIDAGSIVAGAVALPLWTKEYHLSLSTIGWLGALSSNAISAGLGALIGGYLCDRFGRQKIMSYNLLFYIFGVLFLILVQNTAMLFTGYILVGLAVGCDVPATWSMMSESAKQNARGASGALMQVFWFFGPVVVLLMGWLFAHWGILGTRILFAHLLVLAACTAWGRWTIKESERWLKQKNAVQEESLQRQYRELFSKPGVHGLSVCGGMYLFWNLVASTAGFFFPYLLQTFGNISPDVSIYLMMGSFSLGVLGTVGIFIPFSDRVNRKMLFTIGMILQIIAYAVMAFFPITLASAIVIIVFSGVGGGFSAQHFFQLWSTEFFPARLRATAAGFMFAAVRITCGLWGALVPTIAALGLTHLGMIMTVFLVISTVIGIVGGTNHAKDSLEKIEDLLGWNR